MNHVLIEVINKWAHLVVNALVNGLAPGNSSHGHTGFRMCDTGMWTSCFRGYVSNTYLGQPERNSHYLQLDITWPRWYHGAEQRNTRECTLGLWLQEGPESWAGHGWRAYHVHRHARIYYPSSWAVIFASQLWWLFRQLVRWQIRRQRYRKLCE